MTGFIVSTRLFCIEKRSKKVKSKRKGTNLEAMAISRQKMMVTWTRVEAKETEVFCYWTYLEEESSGFSIKLDMEMRKTEIEDNFRKFNCTGDSFDSVN